MNKIEFSKLKNEENKQIAFNQLKDDYKTLYKERDKLESNWKILKEWLIEQRKYDHGEDKYGDTLDKMNELERDKE